MVSSLLRPITWKRSAVVRIKIQEFHIFLGKSETLCFNNQAFVAIDFCPNGKPTVCQSITCLFDFCLLRHSDSGLTENIVGQYFREHCCWYCSGWHNLMHSCNQVAMNLSIFEDFLGFKKGESEDSLISVPSPQASRNSIYCSFIANVTKILTYVF